MSTNSSSSLAGHSHSGTEPAISQGDRAKAVVAAVRLAQPAWAALTVAERVAKRKDALRGYRIVKEPRWLRHFSAELAPIGA